MCRAAAPHCSCDSPSDQPHHGKIPRHKFTTAIGGAVIHHDQFYRPRIWPPGACQGLTDPTAPIVARHHDAHFR